ncbi:MAG: alpha/beta hydrolase [Candidatus Kryptoniota bacterium]
MRSYTLYYATNRHHLGDDVHPTGYDSSFSNDGHENLRFGYLTLQADEKQVRKYINAKVGRLGPGNGNDLADYFESLVKGASIETYTEKLDRTVADTKQPLENFGSTEFLKDLKGEMMQSSDVLVFIHGFNVTWESAVGSALALQEMVNAQRILNGPLMVVLFTWPSEGKAVPMYSYLDDRGRARNSGYAVGRGFLKLRDFFIRLQDDVKNKKDKACGQAIHLLCHSMGNYVLQNALERMESFTQTSALPRLFENIFMCAADVDDTVLEPAKPLGRLNELTRSINVYYNRDDKAMMISETTKGNPERLGYNGCARPYHVHSKVFQIDCTSMVPGGFLAVEHSYYTLGDINRDIVQTIAGIPQDSKQRRREVSTELPNTWKMK